jgi:murein DD-endopeptidase MepM/ murein hydrolase activator NlpD
VLATLLAIVVAVLCGAGLAGSGAAHASPAQALQSQIGARRERAARLRGTLGAQTARLHSLDAALGGLGGRLVAIQNALQGRRSQLTALAGELARARATLAQLQRRQQHAQQVLAGQLVGSYEQPQPDLVTVVLEATGFQDLLNRLDFAERIGRADARAVAHVRATRRALAAQATRLGALEQRGQALLASIQAQRAALDRAQGALLAQRQAIARLRGAGARQLATVQGHLAALSTRLARLRAAQRAAARASQPASTAPAAGSAPASTAPAAGSAPAPSQPAPAPSPSRSGGFVFPLPRSAAAPPSAWSLDQGVDISAPGNTPEYAVCSGTIVLHGIGGFGPWAPVLHCDSPLEGYDYVYYGHAGPANQLPIGTHVGAGQVISSVGPGIVGISTGPHLEIGFADSSGAPVGAGSAPAMLALLHASY